MRQRAIRFLSGALIVFGTSRAFASDLHIGRVAAQPGQPVTVPVTFIAGHGPAITALSSDIHFDKGLGNPRCAAGSALAGVDKVLNCAAVEPGVVRLLIFGLNQDPIPNGEVATVTFDVLKKGRHQLHRLRSVTTASDANGNSLRLARKSGTVRVGLP